MNVALTDALVTFQFAKGHFATRGELRRTRAANHNRCMALGLDSNGLRVLMRLGFGEEKKNYTATYRAVQEAIKNQLNDDYDWLISAHLLLRQHGKELCKTSAPLCGKCPLRKSCGYFEEAFG